MPSVHMDTAGTGSTRFLALRELTFYRGKMDNMDTINKA